MSPNQEHPHDSTRVVEQHDEQRGPPSRTLVILALALVFVLALVGVGAYLYDRDRDDDAVRDKIVQTHERWKSTMRVNDGVGTCREMTPKFEVQALRIVAAGGFPVEGLGCVEMVESLGARLFEALELNGRNKSVPPRPSQSIDVHGNCADWSTLNDQGRARAYLIKGRWQLDGLGAC